MLCVSLGACKLRKRVLSRFARCSHFAGAAAVSRLLATAAPPIHGALGGGGHLMHLCVSTVLHMAFILFYVQIFVCLVAGFRFVLCEGVGLCYVCCFDAFKLRKVFGWFSSEQLI